MTSVLSRALYAILFLAFVSAGCGSGGMDDDEDGGNMGEPQPSFSVASRVVTLADNSQGLQFFATPNADVELTRVNISNPVNQSQVFNANNNVFLSGGAIALQDDNIGFNRVSGTWNFQFIGRRAAGSQASFDVNVPLDVSALVEDTSSDD